MTAPFPTRAFTLIELLMVVAIIAILAAIAIPNFLEAQVRSKVSRAKSDLRSVAVAVESYAVDHSRYPSDYSYGPPVDSYLPRLTRLTTPVGYITSVPEDQFAVTAVARRVNNVDPYRIPYGTGEFVRPCAYDYTYRIDPQGNDENLAHPTYWGKDITRSTNAIWAMRSVGPDCVARVYADPTMTTYDATNGTVSSGSISYSGPGLGFDAGPIK